MRKELKRVIFIAASLAVGLITLSSQTAANLTTGAGQPRQSSATWSPDQQVVARVTVGSKQGLEALIATGVNLLEGRKGKEVFVLTTVAKVEELRHQGWPLTVLFVRGLDANTWQHVEAPLGGGCSFALDPTYLSVTALGGNFSFALNTSDPSCEWTVFSSASWLHVNGATQGTGNTTVFYSVDANATSSNRVGFIFAADQVFTLYQGVQYNDVAVNSPFYEEIENCRRVASRSAAAMATSVQMMSLLASRWQRSFCERRASSTLRHLQASVSMMCRLQTSSTISSTDWRSWVSQLVARSAHLCSVPLTL